MPKFAYVAAGADGALLKGTQEADTLTSARMALMSRELDVRELAEKHGLMQLELTKTRIKRSELMHLSRQLSAFIRAGVPILDAIQVLTDESASRGVQRVMAEIGEDLRAGATLSDAFERHPRDFPAFYRGILRSAELTGRLDTVLDQLSTYIERDLEARRKIKSAITYPAIIVVMSILTVIVLATFVLPKFADFFASLDAELPLPTRMLMATTGFLSSAWYLLLGGFILLVASFLISLRFTSGRYFWHKVLLRVPVLGETVRYAIVERYCRILSSMVSAGVPLTEAMTVARESVKNLVFDRGLRHAYDEMLGGAGLARPLHATKLFPATASQMIRVGEETGSLDAQLEVAAQYFERELDYKIKKVTALIEPGVLLFSGAIVGFVAIALVSAMYGIFKTANLG
ncbi:MAG: type II secretion system F family protein [Nocardioidaceae bacterium]